MGYGVSTDNIKNLPAFKIREIADKLNINANLVTDPMELTNKIIASIKKTANNANNDEETARIRYEEALAQLNGFENNRSIAYKNLKNVQSRYPDEENSIVQTAQAQYNSACSSYTDADSTLYGRRCRYVNSIYFSQKMNNTAIIANQIIA